MVMMNQQSNNIRLTWDQLTFQQQTEYVDKAQYLIDRGYSNKSVYILAETMYNSSIDNEKSEN